MAVQMTADAAKTLLNQVAAQSYGSGMLEGVNGGAGRIGLIGGKPVKFNTHWYERAGKATPEMIKSSNDLRVAIGAAAKALAGADTSVDNKRLMEIYTKLGLNDDGSLGVSKDLLSRKVAMNTIHLINAMGHSITGHDPVVCKNYVNDIKSSKGVDTHFNAVMERAKPERIANGDLTPEEIETVKTEPWKLCNEIKGPVTLKLESHRQHILDRSNAELEDFNSSGSTGFGKQIKGDICRGGVKYSFEGKLHYVPADMDNRSAQEKDAALEKFKGDVNKLFGGNEKLFNFFGYFAHQGVTSCYSMIKWDNPDQQVFSLVPTAPQRDEAYKVDHQVDFSKNNDGSYRMTVNSKILSPNGYNHPDGRDFTVDKPSDKDFYSYSYKLDIAVDENGSIKLSVPEAPVEKFCIMSELVNG